MTKIVTFLFWYRWGVSPGVKKDKKENYSVTHASVRVENMPKARPFFLQIEIQKSRPHLHISDHNFLYGGSILTKISMLYAEILF